MSDLATRLRYAREQAGLSQSALARALCLRPQTIQAIEAGLVARPRALLDLARVLAVRSEWLLWGEGPMAPLGVAENPPDYGTAEPPLSLEAVAFARLWMGLPKAQRDALQSTVSALHQGQRARRQGRKRSAGR